MKSTQLLSVVLSLILVFGVSAGPAFAQTGEDDDYDNNDDSMDNEKYDNYDRHEDDDRDEERDEDDDDRKEKRDTKHEDLEDKLEDFCEMTSEEKDAFFDDHPRIAQFEERLANYCDLNEDEREEAIEEFIDKHVPKVRGYDYDDYDLDDMLDMYCDMSDEQKEKIASMHENADDHMAKVNAYCELDDDEREIYFEEHEDEFKMVHQQEMKQKLENYCEMSDSEKRDYLDKKDKDADHGEKMNRYCELDDEEKMEFIEEHRDEYMAHMKKMMMSDYKKEHKMLVGEMKQKHMEVRDYQKYSRYCDLTEGERMLKIDDPEELERLSEWCELTPEEREAIKQSHHDVAMEFKDKHHESVDAMKMDKQSHKHELSKRLKEMIHDKHDISDEKLEEIKMKYAAKYGDMTDKKKSDLEKKFKDYMTSSKIKMSDEMRSAIHDRVAEMKAFKDGLRENVSDLTDEEKQQLREEFIEKAKDMQLAWISPRIQMNAGVDVQDIECREGFSLVLKASNGIPMCLKSDTALKMIDKGIAVPAN